MPSVTVDIDTGEITLFVEQRYNSLDQADAAKLAADLLQAVEDSVWRTQKRYNGGWFHDTRQIIARAESPLGRAIAAARKVYAC